MTHGVDWMGMSQSFLVGVGSDLESLWNGNVNVSVFLRLQSLLLREGLENRKVLPLPS